MTLTLFDADRPPAVSAALRKMANAPSEERGAVYTREALVAFVLDLVGYTVDQPLARWRVLEPSFGGGDFLLPLVDRLVEAWDAGGRVDDLGRALVAVEVHEPTFERTFRKVVDRLVGRRLSQDEAEEVATAWLRREDFLLGPLDGSFDLVIGNPPYVRPERIPKPLLVEYRKRFRTMYDRADLYVPFIERSLAHLAPQGRLAFVCANRWHKNKYGGPLREMVSRGYHLRFHVDLVGVDAFDQEVIAYPAVTVIERAEGCETVIARRPEIEPHVLGPLAKAMRDPASHPGLVEVATGVVSGRDPWLLHDAQRLALLRWLEARFPPIEQADCKIGIGVATGRDSVFIRPMDALDVEPERMLPLIKAPDIRAGSLTWGGWGLLNPYDERGRLVRLEDWPKFARYLRDHETVLRARNVAKRSGDAWYRTIDKVHPGLRAQPKLLVPDIKGQPHVVLDPGRFYPHHNLYWVTSTRWPLTALRTVLRSDLTRMVIQAYAVEMAGGYLRFQAQYLRRIPIPSWDSLGPDIQDALVAGGDLASANTAVGRAYGLDAAQFRVMTSGSEATPRRRRR